MELAPEIERDFNVHVLEVSARASFFFSFWLSRQPHTKVGCVEVSVWGGAPSYSVVNRIAGTSWAHVGPGGVTIPFVQLNSALRCVVCASIFTVSRLALGTENFYNHIVGTQ